jgi:hypothetical protein
MSHFVGQDVAQQEAGSQGIHLDLRPQPVHQ